MCSSPASLDDKCGWDFGQVSRDCAALLFWIPGELAIVSSDGIKCRSAFDREIGTFILESQGFVGLTRGVPISIVGKFCCRVVIVGRP